jgi:cleavage and polyadenylation specificity factor subunit 1
VKLDTAQSKYSAFDRELLACYLSVRHFRWMLEGQSFFISTDHKPLTFALHLSSDTWSARQQRHLSYVAEYTSDIRHVPGCENKVADALSRPAAAVTPGEQTVDFAQLAREQQQCPDVQQLRASATLKVQAVRVGDLELLCDVSTGVMRPLVPASMRRVIFDALHQLSHPGTRATRRLLSARYMWRGMAADVSEWCKSCVHCARGKVLTHVKSEVKEIPVPAARFEHVHVDIVGPFPTSPEGFSYVLTMVDRTTKWPEVAPLKTISAAECADTFTNTWVARFGVPTTVTTDRGTQFTSAVWACLCRTLNINHIVTSAYHPQSNGMVERFHRSFKASLRARACGTSWADHVPWVLLGLRAAPKEQSGRSVAEEVYGTPLVLPSQLKQSTVPTSPPSPPPSPPSPSLPASAASPTTTPSLPPPGRPTYANVVSTPWQQLRAADFVYVRRGPNGAQN